MKCNIWKKGWRRCPREPLNLHETMELTRNCFKMLRFRRFYCKNYHDLSLLTHTKIQIVVFKKWWLEQNNPFEKYD